MILPTNEKLKTWLDNYFADNKINVEESIKSAFEEVFSEFEFISLDNADIALYFKEDADEFEKDLTLNNFYAIQIDGISGGQWSSTYTYIDNIDNYVVNERTDLCFQNTVIETLTDFQYDATTKIHDRNEWCITVLEKITWTNGNYTRIPTLYIYVPFSNPEGDTNGI